MSIKTKAVHIVKSTSLGNKIKLRRMRDRLDEDTVFCFWEPKNKLPGYLRLCMDTWKLLNLKVVLLNYDNLGDYISLDEERLLKDNIEHYSKPQIADALRVMLLQRYGGIWIDCDTIILPKFKELAHHRKRSDVEFANIARHVGFIWVYQGSGIIDTWYNEVMNRIDYKSYQAKHPGFVKRWDYFSNSIVDSLFDTTDVSQRLDLCTLFDYQKFFPENSLRNKTGKENYTQFYFEQHCQRDDLLRRTINESPMVLLHNSWTPNDYRRLKKNGVLECNNNLSALLRAVSKGL